MSVALKSDLKTLENRMNRIENRVGGINYEMKATVNAEIADRTNVVEQASMQFGLYTALCVDTIDIWKQNRIRWFSPIFHKKNTPIMELPWAHAVSSMGGFDDSGLTWIPPAGSTVCILFENGNRASPYYIGTTWHRNRGPDGAHNWGIDIPEYQRCYEGKRGGYLVGPDDGSQVYPPWNTENYNGFDLSSIVDFASNPEAQKLITIPNIYGFKTPEKHMIKMVDGDPKCDRKWKRLEILSSCGNWIMLKDDHMHYAGQWAHMECGGVAPGDVSCYEDALTQTQVDKLLFGFLAANPIVEDTDVGLEEQITLADSTTAQNVLDNTPKEGKKYQKLECEGKRSNKKVLQGLCGKNAGCFGVGSHPWTGAPGTKYYNRVKGKSEQTTCSGGKIQCGDNPFFKHKQECRPYAGAKTPQNNNINLPQSGVQIMSISGHTIVMDDSVEEPSGACTWDREFDFGCNDHYVGRTYWQSATGHMIEMSDVEGPQGDDGSNLRGRDNFIRLLTATGNKIELNDHTESQPGCVGCPPNIAGSERGIHLQSTSNHTFDMVDEGNEQCGNCRMEGGQPQAKAKKAFVRIRTGYGLELAFNDDSSQEETQQQNIQLFCPQKDNTERGPHISRWQEAQQGPGLVFHRAGGHYVNMTYDNHFTVVGDEEQNPSSKIEYITKVNFVYTKEEYINISDKAHIFYAKDLICLLAGQDNQADGQGNCGCGGTAPNFGAVLVYDYCTGCVRISDRVFASTSGSGQPLSIFQLKPFAKQCTTC